MMACRLKSRQHHITTTIHVIHCKKTKVIDGLNNSKDKCGPEHNDTSVKYEITDKARRYASTFSMWKTVFVAPIFSYIVRIGKIFQ